MSSALSNHQEIQSWRGVLHVVQKGVLSVAQGWQIRFILLMFTSLILEVILLLADLKCDSRTFFNKL